MFRILIVDDSSTQRLMLKALVERLGHEALVAEDGARGVEMAIDLLPDLILLDVVMPAMNGFQATRKLTKTAETAHIPVVLVTSKDQKVDEVWGRRQGAVGYITKPVNEEALIAIIGQLINKVQDLHRSLQASVARPGASES